MVNIADGAVFFNLLQRMSSYLQPLVSLPIGKITRCIGLPVRALLFSSSVCSSSNLRKNNKYVICSITANGLEMPPV
jgi:hypothetical protein